MRGNTSTPLKLPREEYRVPNEAIFSVLSALLGGERANGKWAYIIVLMCKTFETFDNQLI
jgi:hypothetical protein